MEKKFLLIEQKWFALVLVSALVVFWFPQYATAQNTDPIPGDATVNVAKNTASYIYPFLYVDYGEADVQDYSFEIVDSPEFGSANINEFVRNSFTVQQITYDQDVAGEDGPDSFTYKITGPDGFESEAATITLNFIDGATPPQRLPFSPYMLGGGINYDYHIDHYFVSPVGIDYSSVRLLGNFEGTAELDESAGIITYEHPVPLPEPEDSELLSGNFFSFRPFVLVQDQEGLFSDLLRISTTITNHINESLEVAANGEITKDVFEKYEVINDLLGGDMPINEDEIYLFEEPVKGIVEIDSDNRRIITYTPDPQETGTDQFLMAFKRNSGNLVPTSVLKVNVNIEEPENQGPVFTATFDEETITEGDEFTFQFEADDPDGDDPTFTLTRGGDVENASITGGGLFSFIPEVGQAGSYNFTVQVSDGELNADHDFTVIVLEEPNAPPVFTATFDEETVPEGEEFTFQFEANDSNSDDLIFTLTNGGDLENALITANGLFSFAPEIGQAGEYDFTVEVSDGELTANHNFTVIVQEEPNEPPVFTVTFDEEIVPEGEEFAFQFEADDPNGDDLTFTLTSGGDMENASITADGLFSFAPEAGQVGTYDFTVQVSDGELTAVYDFTVIVREEFNETPVFSSTPVTIVQVGELYRYEVETGDPDEDPLTLTAPDLPGWLTFTDNGDGTGLLEGTPSASDLGGNEVVLQVSDGDLTATQEFAIDVREEPNEPPVFTTTFDEENVVEGEEFTFQFEAEDPDGDDLTFTLTNPGGVENVSITEDGLFTFAPDTGQAGEYAFTVQVSDGELTDDHDFVVIVDEVPNKPPVFTATFNEEIVVEGEEFTYQFEAVDPEGETLTFTLTAGTDAENVSFTEAGLFTFAPEFGQAGEYDFTVEVSDGELTAGHSFTMVVEEGNRPPEARDITASTRINIPVTIDLTGFVSDPDGDPLEIINVSAPQHGETNLNRNTVTYTPALNFTGTDLFEYTVADEDGATDTGRLTLKVLGLAFHITDIELPEGAVSRAFDISDEGHVAGIFSESSGSGSAFLWVDGEFEPIPGMRQVFGINNSGNLAGITEISGSVLPAMFLNRTLVPGITMGGNFGALYDINNSDVGVGVADDASGSIAGFFWDENGQQPVVLDDTNLQLYSINDAGILAGYTQFENGREQAVRVLPDRTVQFLANGPETDSRAFGIGNGGHIVGVIHNGTAFRGAMWQNGSVQELPGLGGSTTIAYGVNSSGVIVGTSGTGNQKSKVNPNTLRHIAGMMTETYAQGKNVGGIKAELQNAVQLADDEGLRAVLWIDNDMINLNNLIPSDSGWELIEARAINNHMDIVGYGRLNGQVRAFLLTPADVEEPVAETSVQHVNGGEETVVDLYQQVKNTYGRPTVTELWGANYGTADLRQGQYLHYTVNKNTIAKADTVHYSVIDERGAVAKGKVIFSIEELPDSFKLLQNYPNPFNSSTIIPFRLAENGRVVVELYSIDGRKVGILIDQNLPHGIHRAELRNMDLSSGIYFYRIRVSNTSGIPVFVETKKMSLVK